MTLKYLGNFYPIANITFTGHSSDYVAVTYFDHGALKLVTMNREEFVGCVEMAVL